jgi:serine/threonine protein kinase
LANINLENVEKHEEIGNGRFAIVYRGKLRLKKSKFVPVAIKVLKENSNDSEKMDFIQEAISLQSFNHPNLVKMYGVVAENSNMHSIKYIVLEYMNKGDLLNYLRSNEAKKV